MDKHAALSKRETKQSIARAKKTGFSLTKAGVNLGGNILGGLGVGNVLDLFMQHVADVFHDRKTRRLAVFLDRVLDGSLSEEEQRRIVEGEIDPDDFVSLTQHLVLDDDDEKAVMYAATYRALAQRQIPESQRKDLVRAVSALTMADFQLLHELARATEPTTDDGEAIPPGGKSTANQLVGSHAPDQNHASLHRLLHSGVLRPKDGTRPPLPNALAKTILRVIGPELSAAAT